MADRRTGTLVLFRQELVAQLADPNAQQRSWDAVQRLLDINEIRNGRLHTDATKWAACLNGLGVAPGDLPAQQWDRIRTATVEALYTVIELLQPLIS